MAVGILVPAPRMLDARVLLAAEKALLVPTLGTKLVVSAEKAVVLTMTDEEDEVVTTTEGDEGVGEEFVEVVEVVVGMTKVLVGAWEVKEVVGTGTSEVRAPVTPCLAAQSPRFRPLGQQMVSDVGSCVQ